MEINSINHKSQMEINKEERKKTWSDLGVELAYQKLRTQKVVKANIRKKINMTDLWGPETLYL